MLDINKLMISEKNKNILIILNHIINSGEALAADIVAATGLSIATVSRTLVLLKELNLVVSKGKEITEMGRHPDLFTINSKYGYLLHFYMGADFIKGYLADLSGSILSAHTLHIKRDITIDEFLIQIKACKEALVSNKKSCNKKLIAASVAVPGIVDEKNRIIKRIPNIYNFEGVNLFDYVSGALGIPVIINNQARLSAVGEYIQGYQNLSNLIYIDFTKYRGIGSGIILEGKLYFGKNSIAGEVGDILVDIQNFNQRTGDDGFLEHFAGIGTLFERVNALRVKGHARVVDHLLQNSAKNEIDLELIEQAVLNQDLDVTEVFDETMKMWTMAIINLGLILDPELIILGGELNEKNTVVLSRIKHYLKKMLYLDLDIRLSSIGENAQLFGGIQLLKKYVYNHIIMKKIIEDESNSKSKNIVI